MVSRLWPCYAHAHTCIGCHFENSSLYPRLIHVHCFSPLLQGSMERTQSRPSSPQDVLEHPARMKKIALFNNIVKSKINQDTLLDNIIINHKVFIYMYSTKNKPLTSIPSRQIMLNQRGIAYKETALPDDKILVSW